MTRILAPLLLALVLAGPASAATGGCHAVSGTFPAVQVFPPACTSPLAFCTQGALTGDLAGAYSFVATGVDPATGDFLGHSTITLENGGVLTSDDHSAIDFATGTFTTFIDFAGGTRQFAHATGGLVAPGVLTTSPPGTAGTYSGEYCLGIGARRP